MNADAEVFLVALLNFHCIYSGLQQSPCIHWSSSHKYCAAKFSIVKQSQVYCNCPDRNTHSYKGTLFLSMTIFSNKDGKSIFTEYYDVKY